MTETNNIMSSYPTFYDCSDINKLIKEGILKFSTEDENYLNRNIPRFLAVNCQTKTGTGMNYILPKTN